MDTPMPEGGNLYIMIMQVGHRRVYKIGRTRPGRGLHLRLRELQRQFPHLPEPLEYRMSIEVRTHCRQIERILHAFYAPYRSWGEWFVIPSLDYGLWMRVACACEQWLLEGHPVLAEVRQAVAGMQRTLEGARHGARP